MPTYRLLCLIALAAAACGRNDDNDPPPAGDSDPGDEPSPGDPLPGDTDDGDPDPGDPEPGDPEPGDPEPGDPEPGDPEPGDPEPGDPEPPPHEPGMPWGPIPEPPPPVAPAPQPAMQPVDPGNGTNVPPDPVVVGGPPSTCAVYEVQVPIEWDQDGRHKPYASAITYEYNPPTSGADYEMWAQYGRYTRLARPHWVHNLRHGAIVLVYRPDAPSYVVSALSRALEEIPAPEPRSDETICPRMGIMAPDPELNHTFAVLARGWMMTSNCPPEPEDVRDFAERHIYRAPEIVCGDGAWPVREPCYRFEDTPASMGYWEVPEGTSVTYEHQPPTSGPYYPRTLKYGRYDVPVPAPYWTYILAKGGVVVLYRPDAHPELVAELKREFDALEPHWCGRPLTAMVPDPTLDSVVAFVANNQYFRLECVVGWEMAVFVYSRRYWGTEPSCEDGDYVPE